jgi:putative endonuclease
MGSGRIVEGLTRARDAVADFLRRPAGGARHLATGGRGERLAYYHLRRMGYVMVARNWRTRGRRGEVDLIGWDGSILCFIEVKTRTSHAVATAEAAVDHDKQRELRAMAMAFLRRRSPRPQFRFDVVSVYLIPGAEPVIEVFKDAFDRRSMLAWRRP